jgi:hypothetical protein
VESDAHAILILPDSASFDVSENTAVTCLTANVINGRRILICRGPQSTSFNLNICSDPAHCLQYPVDLQSCSLLQAGETPLATYTPSTPVYLTPVNTLMSPTKRTRPTRTPTPPGETAVPTASPAPGTSTPLPLPTTTSPSYP